MHDTACILQALTNLCKSFIFSKLDNLELYNFQLNIWRLWYNGYYAALWKRKYGFNSR